MDKKLYPTTANFQRSNDTEVPLDWAQTYLADLEAKVPASERKSVVVRGWDKLSLHYEHVVSAEELKDQRLAIAEQLLEQGATDGLTPDQVRAAADRFHAVPE